MVCRAKQAYQRELTSALRLRGCLASEATFLHGSRRKFSFSRPAAPPIQTSRFDVFANWPFAATFNARFIQSFSTFLIPTFANTPPRLWQGLAMNSPQRSLEAD